MPPATLSLEFFKRYEHIIDDWDAFEAYARKPLPITFWTNTIRTSPAALHQKLNFTPIDWYPGAFRSPSDVKPSTLLPFLAGHYQIQEEAAMLPVHLLDPQPGETVLDMCAAPGNKTVQMAVRMASSGLVVANDRSRARLGILRRSISRLGLTNVALTVFDATSLRGTHNSYDKVLADVPCSGEGTVRRYKKNSPFISDKRRQHLSNIQSAILDKAIALCKPDGLIAYSTCTFAPEENEMIVHRALEKHEGIIQIEQLQTEGLETSPGLTSWAGNALHKDLEKTFRVWPHQNDSGGFYTAILRKLGPTTASSARVTADPQHPIASPTCDNALDPYTISFIERFGLPGDVFAESCVEQFGKFMYLRSFRALPANTPAPLQSGLPFCRPLDKSQKMKTGAAMKWGPAATRNVVDLTKTQSFQYGNGQALELPLSQIKSDTTRGYVLLRHIDMYLGLGLLRMEDGQAIIQGLLPKHWIHALTSLDTD